MNGLGKRISELRQKRGLTLPQLAERAGVAKGYLWTLETHLAPNPGVRVVIRIEAAMNVFNLLSLAEAREADTFMAAARQQGMLEDMEYASPFGPLDLAAAPHRLRESRAMMEGFVRHDHLMGDNSGAAMALFVDACELGGEDPYEILQRIHDDGGMAA